MSRPTTASPTPEQAADGELGSILDALVWGRSALGSSPTAALDARLLLGHILGREQWWIVAHSHAALSRSEAQEYRRLIGRRGDGEPVAYLRGWAEWFGMRLEVSRDVLVPRPETEILLERAIAMARDSGATLLADIGTGSGAIAIGLARALPGARVVAVDAGARALAVARRNIAGHGLQRRVRPVHGNLLGPLDSEPEIIVANLPYLSDDMMCRLDRDVRYEPPSALHGGPSGLEVYAALLGQLASTDWSSSVLLEIDPRQSADAASIARELLPAAGIEILRDYAGLDRVLVLERRT